MQIKFTQVLYSLIKMLHWKVWLTAFLISQLAIILYLNDLIGLDNSHLMQTTLNCSDWQSIMLPLTFEEMKRLYAFYLYDYFHPLLYSCALISILAAAKPFWTPSRTVGLGLIPGVLDLIENSIQLKMLETESRCESQSLFVSNIFSHLKWTSAFLLLLFAIYTALLIRNRKINDKA